MIDNAGLSHVLQELTTRRKDEISIRGMRSVSAGKKRDLTIPGAGHSHPFWGLSILSQSLPPTRVHVIITKILSYGVGRIVVAGQIEGSKDNSKLKDKQPTRASQRANEVMERQLRFESMASPHPAHGEMVFLTLSTRGRMISLSDANGACSRTVT